MKRLYPTAVAISAALLVAGAVRAQASLDSVRIEAKDTIGLARFTRRCSVCWRSIGS
jgi:hypothetical protein